MDWVIAPVAVSIACSAWSPTPLWVTSRCAPSGLSTALYGLSTSVVWLPAGGTRQPYDVYALPSPCGPACWVVASAPYARAPPASRKPAAPARATRDGRARPWRAIDPLRVGECVCRRQGQALAFASMSDTWMRVGERPVSMWWRCNAGHRPLWSDDRCPAPPPP